MYQEIIKEINSHKDPLRAKFLSRYFKTGKGQYGEGDVFFGLTVPVCRKIAIKYKGLSKTEIFLLLKNKVHEIRLIGVLILVYKYKVGNEKEKKNIVDFYLKNTKYINNWDLVDLSAHKILGDFLYSFPLHWEKGKSSSPSEGEIGKILLKLAHSKNLWEQRIAIISTFAFLREGEVEWSIKLARIFLNHKHDLMHKATGWVLREVGKKNPKILEEFLNKNISKMPRTMLRYAIEKFPQNIRKEYLKR